MRIVSFDEDPRVCRVAGSSPYIDTLFEVPLVSPIAEGLWVGGCIDGMALPESVCHVVSLHRDEEYAVRHDLKSRLCLSMEDIDTDPIDVEVLVWVARWVNLCRRSGLTLVHCQAGINRSPLVAALALFLSGMRAADAVHLMRELRSPHVLCNPMFEDWLLSFAAPAGP